MKPILSRAQTLSFSLLLCLLAWVPALAIAEGDIAVVVKADSPLAEMSRREVIHIYMGRQRKLSTGEVAVPIDLSTPATKADFYRRLMDKELAEVSAYWSRVMFSGRAHPPIELDSPEGVVKALEQTPGGIGYMPLALVPSSLKVVHTLKVK